jgi:hypothetical protein
VRCRTGMGMRGVGAPTQEARARCWARGAGSGAWVGSVVSWLELWVQVMDLGPP